MFKPLDILFAAKDGRYAVGSFNFSTAEILRAIVKKAQEAQSPIIVSTSESEGKFIGFREAAALVAAWRIATKLPIILNLDHGKSPEVIRKAIAAGYDAIHFDGSSLSYEKNLAETKKMVEYIRNIEKTFDRQILVEGELGYLRGSSNLHKEELQIQPEDLTSPEQANDFADKTGIDSLAVAIGNAHGVFGGGQEKLDLERLAEIRSELEGKVFLVLHGGSGIPDADIKEAIRRGIVKVNVNTEIRVAYKEGIEEEIRNKPEETTPYKILEPAVDAVKKVISEKIKLFGSENKVSAI